MTTESGDAYREYLQGDHWKAAREKALERAWHRCQVCNSPDALDVHHRTYERLGQERPEDLTGLCDTCHSLFHERTKQTLRAVSLESTLREVYDALDARLQTPTTGMPTGFIDLDEKTTGLHKGELTVVAAGPGVGKSAFLLNLTRHIAVDAGHPTLFVSLEHSRVQLAEHLLTAQARVDGLRFRKGCGSADDLDRLITAGAVLRKANLFIDDSARQNMMHIVASTHRLQQEQGIQAVFIDCLDCIEPDNPRQPRQEQIATISRRLKSLAKELRIPVVACARLFRGADDRGEHRPRLSDFRQNAAAEHDADTVLLLHRPELYEPGQYEGTVELIIAKQRNGPTGEITLTFLKQFMRFENFASGIPFDS